MRSGWHLFLPVAAFFAAGMALKTLLATTTVQSNSIASVVAAELGWSPLTACAVIAVLTAAAILGGVRTVAAASKILAPVMGVLYLTGAAAALFVFRQQLLPAMGLVFEHAFSPIAHASARTNDPVQQGKIAMVGVLLDTLIVSSATGLVLLASGVWNSGLDSTALTASAFSAGLGKSGGWIVLAASVLFGLSTLISWAFYGEQCAAYLFGPKAHLPYRLLYCFAILGGAAAGARAIWAWADLLNGIMAIPNLIALVVLGGEVGRMLLTRTRGASAT